jgi:curved DNA-binding protein CbpA
MLDRRNLVENSYGVLDLLVKTSSDFVRGFRRIRKMGRVRLPLVNKLPSAFAALGLPLQDPSSPSFDLAPVRAAFKAEALRTHPDRAGPDVAPGSFQKVKEAWETIDKAYNRAKKSREYYSKEGK